MPNDTTTTTTTTTAPVAPAGRKAAGKLTAGAVRTDKPAKAAKAAKADKVTGAAKGQVQQPAQAKAPAVHEYGTIDHNGVVVANRRVWFIRVDATTGKRVGHCVLSNSEYNVVERQPAKPAKGKAAAVPAVWAVTGRKVRGTRNAAAK